VRLAKPARFGMRGRTTAMADAVFDFALFTFHFALPCFPFAVFSLQLTPSSTLHFSLLRIQQCKVTIEKCKVQSENSQIALDRLPYPGTLGGGVAQASPPGTILEDGSPAHIFS
jgi:hypothetical protein